MSVGTRWKALLARREQVFGMNRRNVDLVYALNRRSDYPLADDKLLAKDLLAEAGVAVPKTLVRVEHPGQLGPAMDRLMGQSDFVVKPARGSGGQGIVVVGEACEEGWKKAGGQLLRPEDLARHLAEILFGAFARGPLSDRAFVEERIHPHPTYAAFWQDGLTDLRVITHKARALLAMVRVPTQGSQGKANLHQGGLGLAVNLSTGSIHRALWRGQSLTHHPESGAPLLGVTLPLWERSLEVALAAARAAPLGYLGVDLAVDAQRGPMVLEINARPGLEIQNVNGLGLGDVLAELPQ